MISGERLFAPFAFTQRLLPGRASRFGALIKMLKPNNDEMGRGALTDAYGFYYPGTMPRATPLLGMSIYRFSN